MASISNIILCGTLLLITYYVILFIYLSRKQKSFLVALRQVFIYAIPVLALCILIELVCRFLVSGSVMKYSSSPYTRHSAIAYYLKTFGDQNKGKRYIRLKELTPGINKQMRGYDGFLETRDNFRDTIYTLRTDQDGFILPECCGGKRRIIFIGGSTTECLYVQEKNRFPYRVAVALNANGVSCSVKNSGVGGNHVFHSIDILINKILPYKPDMVIQMETINDLTTLLYEKTYYNRNHKRSLILDNELMTKEATGTKNHDDFYEHRLYKKKVDTLLIVTEYKSALRLFVSICKSQNVEPVLMTQFNRIDSSQIGECKTLVKTLTLYKKEFPGFNFIVFYKRMNQAVREIAAEENVFLIDLDFAIPRSSKYMYDMVHLNDSGAMMVAGVVADRLRQSPILANK